MPPSRVCSPNCAEVVKCRHLRLTHEEQSPVKGHVQVNWDRYRIQMSRDPLFLGPGGWWATRAAPRVKPVFAQGQDVCSDRATCLPVRGPGAAPEMRRQLAACTPNHGRSFKDSSGQTRCWVPSSSCSSSSAPRGKAQTSQMGWKSRFSCICVMTFC